MNKKLEDELELVLGIIYAKANWKELNIKRSAYDFFSDKIRVSANESNFKTFLEKLMIKMKVKTHGIDLKIIDNLNSNSREVLGELRQSIYSYWGLKGALKGKKIKEDWKK